MVQIRSGFLLDIQIDEDSFTDEEVKDIKEELANKSQSEFIVKVIKNYLQVKEQADDKEADEDKVTELKALIERNYSLLQEIKHNKSSQSNFDVDASSKEEVYNENQQEARTDQALNLLNQF
ncbi:hypothetical protein JCM16358_08920 [Halanaerocella petrolearia]